MYSMRRGILVTLVVTAWLPAMVAADAPTPPKKKAPKQVRTTPKSTLSSPAPAAPADPDAAKVLSRAARLWSLQPVRRPEVPAGLTASSNPIDAFIAEKYKEK